MIGSEEFKTEYVSEKVSEWVAQLEILSEIAKFDPHSAYTAFTAALRHRYTFFMRTIPDIGPLMKPVEAVIREKLIPALTEDRKVTDDERLLMSYPQSSGAWG